MVYSMLSSGHPNPFAALCPACFLGAKAKQSQHSSLGNRSVVPVLAELGESLVTLGTCFPLQVPATARLWLEGLYRHGKGVREWRSEYHSQRRSCYEVK
jgi:hypothetical protein